MESGSSYFQAITPGLRSERIITVEKEHTVSHLKVPVLSTPMMISMMETVSKDLIQELLPPGFTTVGYEVHVKHKAAAQLGTEVKSFTKVLEVDGRKLLFEVRVTAGEKLIGEGFHRRTIVPIS